jgi:hypothetical protein
VRNSAPLNRLRLTFSTPRAEVPWGDLHPCVVPPFERKITCAESDLRRLERRYPDRNSLCQTAGNTGSMAENLMKVIASDMPIDRMQLCTLPIMACRIISRNEVQTRSQAVLAEERPLLDSSPRQAVPSTHFNLQIRYSIASIRWTHKCSVRASSSAIEMYPVGLC